MEYEIGPATRADLPGITEVFRRAFDESVRHIFGSPEPSRLVADLFAVCLDAEPEALFVARGGLEDRPDAPLESDAPAGSTVLGYIFAPSDVRRVRRAFLSRGYALKWLSAFLRGQSGVGWSSLRKLAANKLTFLFGGHPPAAGGHARILSIGVLPEVQGRGIATGLLEAGLKYLDRKTERVVLEVRPWNGPAMHLYRKYGFRMVGESRDTQGAWFVMVREKTGR